MENKIKNNPAPLGYSTVSPYLMVESVEKQLEFLKNVFEAEITEVLRNPEGHVWHGEARIGDTLVMMGRAQKEYPAISSMLYVFTENVDQVYQRALDQGATSINEPKDQFYGNREAGVRDPQGNIWWIAHEIEKVSDDEAERRLVELQNTK
ncbi:MAG TPA: VOC family protein [Anaerolineae bacterium]|nr:VOC family protein [Anaerolineae bacterium]